MISHSDEMKEYLAHTGRAFNGKIKCGDNIIYEGIMSIEKSETVCSGCYTFGSFNVPYADVVLYDNALDLGGCKIDIYIGAYPDGETYEEILIGTFIVEKPKTLDKLTSFTAYGELKYKASNIFYKDYSEETAEEITASSVFFDICTVCGLEAVSLDDNTQINGSLFCGLECAQALSIIAAFEGGNVCMNNEGKVEIRKFTQTNIEFDDDMISMPEMSDKSFSPAYIKCFISENEYLVCGNDSGNIGIEISCPIMTQTRLNELWSQTNTVRYFPINADILVGNPYIEAGDIVSVNFREVNYNVPIMSLKTDFDGGIMNTICSFAETPEEKSGGISLSEKISQGEKATSFSAEFSKAINGALGMFFTKKSKADGSTIIYGHNEETLPNSTYIFTNTSEGFAFTTGENCWNNGNPDWQYGVTKDGNAILNILQAYKITADIIETGIITSNDGKTSFNLDTGVIKTEQDIETDEVETGEQSAQLTSGSLSFNSRKEFIDTYKEVFGQQVLWLGGQYSMTVDFASDSGLFLEINDTRKGIEGAAKRVLFGLNVAFEQTNKLLSLVEKGLIIMDTTDEDNVINSLTDENGLYFPNSGDTGITNNGKTYDALYARDFAYVPELWASKIEASEIAVGKIWSYDSDNNEVPIFPSEWKTIEDTDIESDFHIYGSTSVKYKQSGAVINLVGVLTPTTVFAANSTEHLMFTLPEEVRPANRVYQLCQGSQSYKWLISISPAGEVYFSRYGSGSGFIATTASTSPNYNNGTWLPFNVTYMI